MLTVTGQDTVTGFSSSGSTLLDLSASNFITYLGKLSRASYTCYDVIVVC